MALSNKKYSAIHNKTGSDKDKIKNIFDEGHITHLADNPEDNPTVSALMYQIQEMQDELDYLRTEISSNKDNKTVVGSNTTISFGDLTSTTVKGKVTYTLALTATRDFGGKVGSQTKSVTLTLT
jgi:capsule polysaccharide export protein KpsE/RkpR